MVRSQSSDMVSLESSASIVSSTTANTSGGGQTGSTVPKTHFDAQLEDACSTDSSSIDDEHKKRRRKLFPFGGKKLQKLEKQKIKTT